MMDKNLQETTEKLIATMEEGMSRSDEDNLGTDFYYDCVTDVGEEGMKLLCNADREELISYMTKKMMARIEDGLRNNIDGLLVYTKDCLLPDDEEG